MTVEGPGPEPLGRILAFIDQRLGDPRLSPGMVAAAQ
jgi:hypothetical protein